VKLGESIVLVVSLVSLAALSFVLSQETANGDGSNEPGQAWVLLFDGKTIDDWERTNFGGEGDITVEDGAITLDYGADLTGVHRDWPLPRMNYEVELEAKKVEGSDFFLGLTFPVGDEQDCSLILGGWGGGVCGLSCIDSYDASENETTDYRHFTAGQWYKVKVRVLEKEIAVWIDDQQYFAVETEGKKFGVRFEVELSRPFGLCAFVTRSQYRNVRARPLTGP
jgi:hypothetical protein